MTSQRSELYGDTDFLANCGGLMGLCLGVSVISLFEIVYFCTLRLWFNLSSNKIHDRGQSVVLEEPNSRSTGLLKLTKDLFADYSKKTTIQGIKYVANGKLSQIERLWWVVVVVISTICCGTLISDVFKRYDENPVIISFENQETPVSQVINHSPNYSYFLTLIQFRFRFLPSLCARKSFPMS
jgi:Amiloride-sensitive sodium channel